MRGAKCVESTTSDPPKPRLNTGRPGKSCARVVQRRIIEEPMNSIPPRGGGLVRSDFSYAEISCSHLAKSWLVSAPGAGRDRKMKTAAARVRNRMGFMGLRLRPTGWGENIFRAAGRLAVRRSRGAATIDTPPARQYRPGRSYRRSGTAAISSCSFPAGRPPGWKGIARPGCKTPAGSGTSRR